VLSNRQAIEAFHLIFLRALVAKGEDKSLIALKRGCNLRFYFGSVRYSEDIDLDVAVISKGTLKNKVERLLRSPLVGAPLQTKGIELGEISAPKQTDTTQRWKVELRWKIDRPALRTKIEFSRRDVISGAVYEVIDAGVLRPYGLTPILSTHYGLAAAIGQKVHALAGRAEPQARDVFDLNLLLARPDAAGLRLNAGQQRWLPNAIERALSLSYDDYRSQVVAYLDPEQAAPYQGRAVWDALQEAVITRLETLQ
jgi:predicted nucleotidyltransferase component of viral defense system